MTITHGKPSVITKRLTDGAGGADSDTAELEVRIEGKVLRIRSLTARQYCVTTLDGLQRRHIGGSTYSLPLRQGPNEFTLHFRDVDTAHRVAVFELFQEVGG